MNHNTLPPMSFQRSNDIFLKDVDRDDVEQDSVSSFGSSWDVSIGRFIEPTNRDEQRFENVADWTRDMPPSKTEPAFWFVMRTS